VHLTKTQGGTSMAATLTVAARRPGRLLYTWADALAAMPAAAGRD
jgi:hypothetical protein